MDNLKKSFLKVFEKFKHSESEKSSIKTYWRLIIISHLTITAALVVFGWLIYGWSITTTSTVVNQKKQRPSITMEDLKKANDILTSKKDRLDSVINEKVEVVGLR